MPIVLEALVLSSSLALAATEDQASLNAITINPTTKVGLLDGSCGNDEWDTAIKVHYLRRRRYT